MHVLLLCLAALVPAEDQPKPIAMVLSSKGAVTLERGDKKAEPLRAMDLLLAGDRLSAAADAEARVVFLADGHSEALKPKCQATVGEKGCTPAEAVEVQAKKLNAAQLRNLKDHATSSRAGVGVPRGPVARGATLVVGPPSGSTVLTVRPTFTWDAVDKAKEYVVELRENGGKFVLLWGRGETTTKPRLDYPADRGPLEYGTSYQWRVTAKLEGGEEQAFEWSVLLVVAKAEGEELARLKPLTESKEPTDWLLAAVTYEAHGVYTESLPLYEKLAKEVPNEANYHKTLANYYERAGRTDEAEKERAQAKKLTGKNSHG